MPHVFLRSKPFLFLSSSALQSFQKNSMVMGNNTKCQMYWWVKREPSTRLQPRLCSRMAAHLNVPWNFLALSKLFGSCYMFKFQQRKSFFSQNMRQVWLLWEIERCRTKGFEEGEKNHCGWAKTRQINNWKRSLIRAARS